MVVKPGYKTSEFLAAALASISSWLFEWQGSLNPRYAAIVTAVAAGTYILSRAITKHGVALGNARVVPVATSAPLPVQSPVVPATPPQV
jgi:hypothetical protein